jgi:photoactive yellow protein
VFPDGIDFLEFDSDDIENIMTKLSPGEIDKLSFGAIRLDASGVILQYNRTEGQLGNVDPKTAIGKNFFTELAPCANTPSFRGAFEHVKHHSTSRTMIEYTFKAAGAQPTKVLIHMKQSIVDDTFWIFVKRL